MTSGAVSSGAVRSGARRAGAVRSGARFLASALAALLGLQVVLLAGLVAAQAVPNGPIITALARAVDEGTYGPAYVPDGLGGTADRFTECVVVGYGVSSTDDPRSTWYRATGGPRLESCELGLAQVRALAAGQTLHPEAGYYRYWNGYSVLTRPVLALLGLPGLRLVVAGLLALAAASAVLAVRRHAGLPAALALLVPLAGATNAVAMPATASSHGIALAAVAAGVAGTAVASRRGWRGAVLGAGGAAALFAYVDLLTTPATSWALCAAVAGAVASARGAALARTLGVVVAAGAAWPVAYGVTWVSRWVVAALVQGPEVLTRVREVGRFRLGGDNARVTHELGAPTTANASAWVETTATAVPLLVAAAGVVAAALAAAVVRHGPGALARAAVLAAPALVVPAWYEVLSNHSQIHAFFTYRSLPAAVGVVAMAALVAAVRPRRAGLAVVAPYDTRAAARPEGRAARRPQGRAARHRTHAEV